MCIDKNGMEWVQALMRKRRSRKNTAPGHCLHARGWQRHQRHRPVRDRRRSLHLSPRTT
jgi:hypothetical protein